MSTWPARLLSAADRRIGEATASDEISLSYLRIAFGLFTMLVWWPSYSWLGTVPDSFFDPPALSVVALFDRFPPPAFLAFLDAVVIASTLTLTVGLYTRASAVLLLASVLIGNHFAYSFGKIDHGLVLPLCLLAVMTFSDWGRYLSVDSLRRGGGGNRTCAGPHCEPVDLRIVGVLVAFGFFTAGFGKALRWVDLDPGTSGFLSWLYQGYFNLGRDQLLAGFAFNLRPLWLWEFGDIIAVVFELGFGIALLSRRAWRTWLMAACVFHLLNLLVLNISFAAGLIVYLAFAPVRLLLPDPRALRRPGAVVLAIFVLGLAGAAIKILGGSPGGVLFTGVRSLQAELLVGAALCVATLAVLIVVFSSDADGRQVPDARIADPVPLA